MVDGRWQMADGKELTGISLSMWRVSRVALATDYSYVSCILP
ncbi:hypothetical protein [Allocoleopsis franciscana]|uniref:Uncharacterized protein n=1 Tax=Allocoleopsis franciscana PCC 7113 TaxID=1173027 RepID=K9WI07_9CYAN|nr:hypothetical protein [Allocoleopsis franciscana]AFZ19142.1 hypothetical protein Mic7113_3413 [Allocoleopsis franciscana PCC 7113]